ncbi:MAG: 4Fe-4S dicluster domain-containing protein [Anaerolineales bacterium]|nr:4Fe-4S dicluster domain-containing protein [Anaerolineales bacterium]
MTTTPVEVPSKPETQFQASRWLLSIKDLFLHAVLQDRVLQRLYPGVMHLLLFWGVSIQILGSIIALLQFELFLPFTIPFPVNTAYLWFELIMDIAGIMIILGALMALIRRLVIRPKSLVNRWDDWYAIAILLLVPIIGFFSEALRFIASQPSWRFWAPFGNILAEGLIALGVDPITADALHQFFFWGHIVVALIFVVSIPFTKLRHLITGPLNIVTRPLRPAGALEPIEDIEEAEKLGVGEINEFSSDLLLDLNTCVQCGRCEDACPSNLSGMPYSPRELILNLRKEFHSTMISANGNEIEPIMGKALDKETPWYCTTCGACLKVCPLFVNPVDTIVDLRRYLTLTTGDIPGEVGEALMGMERRGNPWSMPKESHAPWVKEMEIPIIQPGEQTDVLLFIGCAFGYDSRSQQAGKSLAKILQKASIDFAVLGDAEGCCGETARRLGHEYLFQVMAEENIETFNSIKFNRIISPCAHCFSTLKNEYPQFGGEFRVQHHTEFLSELVHEGRLRLKSSENRSVFTYHDSCYLGRYNDIYNQPRHALNAVPDLTSVELPRNKENAFCCGGGGGHMWMEIDPETRINHRRLQEVVDSTKADTIVTACPYCLIMFDDAIRSKGIGESVEVKDISEVLTDHVYSEG